MANIKTGFIYYQTDVNRYEDVRIRRLLRAFSCNGIAVYDYILREIYGDKGCFVTLEGDTAFYIADTFHIKENTVREIIQYCGSVGLFNQELLSRGIISSESIQKRYKLMCAKAGRKCYIPQDVNLINHVNDIEPVKEEQKPVVYETVQDQIQFIITDNVWLEHIRENYKIQDLQPFFTEFVNTCLEAKNNHGGDVNECRKHFVNWLRKYPKNKIDNNETAIRNTTNAVAPTATDDSEAYDNSF